MTTQHSQDNTTLTGQHSTHKTTQHSPAYAPLINEDFYGKREREMGEGKYALVSSVNIAVPITKSAVVKYAVITAPIS